MAEAVKQCNAWVLSGGTDTGIMRLVGDALARFEVKQPLIAIAPHGAIYGREDIDRTSGGRCRYSWDDPASEDGAPLNPYHTHFLLVDSGRSGKDAWQSEIKVRARFESEYAYDRKVCNTGSTLLLLKPGCMSSSQHPTLPIIQHVVDIACGKAHSKIVGESHLHINLCCRFYVSDRWLKS